MNASPLKVWVEKEGGLLRLHLDRPKANIIDAAMIAALRAALGEHLSNPHLRAVLLDAEGPHFSFGASVEEHLPESCGAMLQQLHALVLQILECPVPFLVAIKGQCLGGGLEVAAAGHLLFAAPTAMLGQPEIKLAVFAPAASCLLPERIGQAHAEDLLFSGRSVNAGEAHGMGLVDVLAEDPEEAARAYYDEHFAARSASSLRFAVRAARIGVNERIRTKLEAVERLYLDELMATLDAVEGLTSFLGKRSPVWADR
ncbi:MAG TPA: cyclohexa-1,5-dienecarbonyl-CoA hydratase [Geothrix sp.]|nr:cyclohexa-1,5-dienecarbonyl-CoA hydratase [Geothrix sp.]